VPLLGETGDRRAIPLLRQAISSPNVMHRSGKLPRLGLDTPYNRGLPEAPADAAFAIAQYSLIHLDDREAQTPAKLFLKAPAGDQQVSEGSRISQKEAVRAQGTTFSAFSSLTSVHPLP
jgi:HEAT repeat protein